MNIEYRKYLQNYLIIFNFLKRKVKKKFEQIISGVNMLSLVTLKDSYYNNGMDRVDDLKYTREKEKATWRGVHKKQ